jgi:hypothetical protein
MSIFIFLIIFLQLSTYLHTVEQDKFSTITLEKIKRLTNIFLDRKNNHIQNESSYTSGGNL